MEQPFRRQSLNYNYAVPSETRLTFTFDFYNWPSIWKTRPSLTPWIKSPPVVVFPIFRNYVVVSSDRCDEWIGLTLWLDLVEMLREDVTWFPRTSIHTGTNAVYSHYTTGADFPHDFFLNRVRHQLWRFQWASRKRTTLRSPWITSFFWFKYSTTAGLRWLSRQLPFDNDPVNSVASSKPRPITWDV